ncbi:MAG: hypothetical protein SVU32_06295, partial [Candidatus Nanohaloarchaea archaeon]|nr:hypothetical protein [Candidatus Nanohaloarchaea archaeon]
MMQEHRDALIKSISSLRETWYYLPLLIAPQIHALTAITGSWTLSKAVSIGILLPLFIVVSSDRSVQRLYRSFEQSLRLFGYLVVVSIPIAIALLLQLQQISFQTPVPLSTGFYPGTTVERLPTVIEVASSIGTSYWLGITFLALFFTGPYMIARGSSLPHALKHSPLQYIRRPFHTSSILLIAFLLPHLGLILAAAPFQYLGEQLMLLSNIPLAAVAGILGANTGFLISARFVTAMLDRQEHQ